MTKAPRKPSKPLLREEPPLRGQPRRVRDPQQPNLPFDPMPSRIEPCLALLKPKPPEGPDWIYEIKWDGYRIAVHVDHGKIRVLTRGGHDWTDRFPAIEAAARSLPVASAILDGEAVMLDEVGRSDFNFLQSSLGGRSGKRASDQSIMYAFDLLYFDGHDISRMDQDERRHMLTDLLEGNTGAIRLSEEIEGEGGAILQAAKEHGLEGIIAKRRDQPYRSGRHGDWVKIKCTQSESFFIVGYELSMTAGVGIGSLVLAAYKGSELNYVGSVGTGFKEREASELREMLDSLKTKKAPIAYAGRRTDIVWCQPTLIAEIKYRGWTGDGKLRHAVYKGLREVQDNAAVFDMGDDQ